MRRLLLLVSCAVLPAACGGTPRTSPPARLPLTAAQARPAPLPVAATLAHVPDTRDARTRLGFVDAARLPAAPLPAAAVADAVLGAGARPGTVRVGPRAVVPAAAPPSRTIINDDAMSAIQFCLGDAIAQTVVGPGVMGADGALGVSVIRAERGFALRACGAPHFKRELAPAARAIRRGTGVRATRMEINDRLMVTASVPLRRLPGREILALLAGGPALRALGWR